MSMATFDGDLSRLSDLDVESILRHLKFRFRKDKIYSRCGDILIAVNPYKNIGIYDKQNHDNYHWKKVISTQEPHIFGTTALAFQRLQETKTDQVILVSGESGAGKTETTKYIIKHLVEMCGDSHGNLHKKILMINPLMEALGNARTNLNKNSSRFAKYIQINIGTEGFIQGAFVREYLLEKSRVVRQPRGERNFHIFYAFLDGIDSNLKQYLLLDDRDFRIVKGCVGNNEDHQQQYTQYLEIMKLIGLSPQDIQAVQIILAAIIHITELTFEDDDSNSMGVIVSNEDDMVKAAGLLRIDVSQFGICLVSENITFAGEEITTLKTVEQAEEGRDALAKAIYERLFGWMIRNINVSLQTQHTLRSSSLGSLGILDICGFEIMQTNGLEQLCINLVNEQLQGFMNDQVFKREQEIYESEGLTLENIDYPDNKEILNMFNKSTDGIINLIDEDTKLAQATNISMVHKISKRWSSHKHFKCSRNNTPKFGIVHFAGEVIYDASHFIEKNGNKLSSDLAKCIVDSSNGLISDLFKVKQSLTGSISTQQYNYRESTTGNIDVRPSGIGLTRATVNKLRKSIKSGRNSKNITDTSMNNHKTQLSFFVASIKELLQKMNSAEPLFVRCINPNTKQQSSLFTDEKVREQLNYLGVKEIAKIRRLCFPVRRSYDEFYERYKCLVNNHEETLESMDTCKLILKHSIFTDKDYLCGKTQVFMIESVKQTLEDKRQIKLAEEEELRRKRYEEEQRQRKIDEAEELQRKKNEKEDLQRLRDDEKEQQRKRNEEELQRKRNEEEEQQRKRNEEEEKEKKKQRKTTFELVTGMDTINEGSQSTNSNDTSSLSAANNNNDVFFKDDSDIDDDDDDDFKFWDPFEIVPRDPPSSEVNSTVIFRLIKLFLYGYLFLLLLSCCVSQKLCLIITLAKFPKTSDKPNYSYLMNCILAICIPYALNVLIGGAKILFGHFTRPSLVTFLVVIFTEMLHTFGLCLLILGVLPYYKGLLPLLLLSAVAIVPSILHLVASTHRANKSANITTCVNSTCGRVISYMLDGICIIAQGSVIVIMIMWFYDDNHVVHTRTSLNHIIFKYAELICGFICVSFGWWENFLDDRFLVQLSQMNRMKNFFLSIRYDLQEGRYYTVMVTYVLKIVLTLTMVYVYYPDFYNGVLSNLTKNLPKDEGMIPFIVWHLSAFVAFYAGKLACKLQMQIVSFSLPLILATPGAVFVAYMSCEYNVLKDWFSTDDVCNAPALNAKMAVGAAWYISLLWITRHIWFPRQERLAKYDRMFVNPMYCGIFTTESLILNRRRHMRLVQKVDITKEDKVETYYILAKTESKGEDSDNIAASDTESVYTDYEKDKDPQNVDIPVIYACATMWHETRTEMLQILKSLHRIDAEQWMRSQAKEMSGELDPEFFNYEAHIFFDDIMEQNDDEEWQVNDFVALMVECMEDAVSSVHNTSLRPHPPVKIPTPYGGQLLYKMPGGNLLYVHLKDKNKIRHRKRWSQVMYMYYLLGFKLLKDCEEITMEKFADAKKRKKKNWNSSEDFEHRMSEETKIQSKNTFILALDGDTDFSPVAVRLLLDRMKKNDKAAAACGRIHPIGSGPLVWFQKFEYAVGHWLQKATEHVFGCVLCSPGCFSLFRGSALMDRNVMKKYTILPTEPGHYLQYDQGEDRWLCTLLLQQGYRVDYAAAADAVTYAPEGFNEFFNQRRRWMPSTLANIMDLLGDYKNTVAVNNNISMLYILYHVALMVSTVLGPATVLMMIASAFKEVFGLDIWLSYGLSLGPAVAYVIICLTANGKTQLLVAALLSTFYAFVMIMVLAATIITAATKSVFDPSVMFISGLVILFIITGCMHPYEIFCLPWGALYFLCIPSGYLLLVIYSICNLDNISWGTREIPKKKTKAELEAEQKAAQEKKQKSGLFAKLFYNKEFLRDIKEILSFGKGSNTDPILEEIKAMNKNIKELLGKESDTHLDIQIEAQEEPAVTSTVVDDEESIINESKKKTCIKRDDLKNPFWITDSRLGNGTVGQLDSTEVNFWKDFMKKYLTPLEKDKEKEKHVKASLLELRNNIVYAMSMTNLLWIGINFVFQKSPTAATTIKVKYTFEGKEDVLKIDMLGFVFILFFAIVLLVQFIGMLSHRWGTFLHLISITEIKGNTRDQSKFEEMLNLYTEMNRDIIPMRDIKRTTPPDMTNDGVPLGKSLRATTKNTSVDPLIVENFRRISKYRSRPLPPVNQPFNQTALGDFRKTVKDEGILRQRALTGFSLKKTNKGRIKRAQEKGITFEPIEDPTPDYEDNEDPVYDFLKQDKNTMSRQFARRYMQYNRATRNTRRYTNYNNQNNTSSLEETPM